jgi:hypothetical protein
VLHQYHMMSMVLFFIVTLRLNVTVTVNVFSVVIVIGVTGE